MADNNPNWQVVLIRDGEIYGYMDEPNVYARHMKDVPHLVFTAEGGVKTLRRGRTNTWKANELCRELEKIISPESAAEHKKEKTSLKFCRNKVKCLPLQPQKTGD